MVVLGRGASGERFASGLLLDSWSVRRAGRLAWTDTLRVEGETPDGAGFGSANALATIIGVWDEPQSFFEKARPLLESEGKVRAGVTVVNGVMVARLLGEATQVREARHPLSERSARPKDAARLACLMQLPAGYSRS